MHKQFILNIKCQKNKKIFIKKLFFYHINFKHIVIDNKFKWKSYFYNIKYLMVNFQKKKKK